MICSSVHSQNCLPTPLPPSFLDLVDITISFRAGLIWPHGSTRRVDRSAGEPYFPAYSSDIQNSTHQRHQCWTLKYPSRNQHRAPCKRQRLVLSTLDSQSASAISASSCTDLSSGCQDSGTFFWRHHRVSWEFTLSFRVVFLNNEKEARKKNGLTTLTIPYFLTLSAYSAA